MAKLMEVPAADATLPEQADFELSTTNAGLKANELPPIPDERVAPVRAWLSTLEGRLAKVKQDDRLTERGKADAVKEAVAAALAVVDDFEKDATADFDKRVSYTETHEVKPPERLEPVEQLLRQHRLAEVRACLGVTDQVEAEAVFHDEAATDEVRQALLDAPPSLVKLDSGELRLIPLVRDETRSKYMLGEAERRSPEAYKRLVGLRKLRETHRNLAHALRAMIAKRTGVDPQADVIAERAKGAG